MKMQRHKSDFTVFKTVSLLLQVLILHEKITIGSGLSFNITSNMLRVGQVFNLTINEHPGETFIEYKFLFGDGQSRTFAQRDTIISHSYSASGDRVIKLGAKESSSSTPTSTTMSVSIRHTLKNLTFTTSSLLCAVGESINLTTTVVPDVEARTHWKLGSTNWTKGTVVKCEKVGVHSFVIFAENDVSAVVLRCPVNITVINLNFTISALVASSNSTVTFTRSNASDHLENAFLFPDGTTIPCPNRSIYYMFTDASPREGFEVKLIASDGNNKASITKRIIILHSLRPPFTITNKEQAGTGLPVLFHFALTGVNLSYKCDFGDRSPIPMIFGNGVRHTYLSVGRYCINCTAHNQVSQITSSSCVTVIEAVGGLDFVERIAPRALGTATEIGLELHNGTDVNVTLDCGDGTVSEIGVIGNVMDILVVFKSHKYSAENNYNVSIKAVNPVSSASKSSTAFVQIGLTNLDVSISYNTTCLEVNGTLTQVVTVNGTNPQFEYVFSDGNSTIYTTKRSLTKSFQKFGIFTSIIRARNKVSSLSKTMTIKVCKPVLPLKSMEIITSPRNFTVPVNFTFKFPEASDFWCTFVFGDGTSKTYCFNYTFYEDMNTDKTHFQNIVETVVYKYTSVGVYDVKIRCWNRLSNITNSTVAIVQKPIQQCRLQSIAPQIYGRSIPIKWNMTLGTNVTFEINSNGVKYHSVILTDTGGTFTFQQNTHYPSPGVYRIEMNAANVVSQFNSSFNLIIQKDVTEMTFNITATNSYIGPGVPGFGPEHNLYPVEYPVNFTATVNRGTNLTYNFSLGHGPIRNITEPTTVYKYPFEKATYIVSVTAYNLVSSMTKSRTIGTHKGIHDLQLTNNGPMTQNHTLSFNLEIGEFGTDTCFVWNMTDGTEIRVFGPNNCNSLSYPEGVIYTLVTEESSSISFGHVYPLLNEYYVTVDATNAVSRKSAITQAVSVQAECFYPNISMKELGQNASTATTVHRSVEFQVSNEVEIYCEMSLTTKFEWKIYTISDSTGEEQTVDSCGTNMKSPILTIPTRCLEYGLHRFEITVTMQAAIGVRTTKTGYRNITSTPYINARIKGGSYVKIGAKKMVTLDFRGTQDPDYDVANTTGMTFVLLCRNVSEPAFMNLTDPFSIPVVELPTTWVDHGAGGCFGTGAGRLNYTGPLVVFDTNQPGWTENKTYIFTVFVSKTNKDGTKYGRADQAVELSHGDPPVLGTTCVQNCENKVDTGQKFALLGHCRNCTGRLTFKWECFKLTSCDANPNNPKFLEKMPHEEFIKMLYTQKNGLNMAVKPNKLQPLSCYVFSWKAYRTWDIFGESRYYIITNSPPENGTVTVSRFNGTALNTSFTLKCANWQDVDGPLHYEYGYKVSGENRVFSYGRNTSVNCVLPVGDPTNNFTIILTIRITDSFSAAALVRINVQVFPPNETDANVNSYLEYLVFDENSELNVAYQTGDVPQVNQICTAASSLLNLLSENAKALKESGKNLTEEESATVKEQEEKREKIRRYLIGIISKTDAYTVADVRMMSNTLILSTKEYTEVDSETQELVMRSLRQMTYSIERHSSDKNGFDTVRATARTLLGCLAQVALSSAASADVHLIGTLSSKEKAIGRVLLVMDLIKTTSHSVLDNLVPGEGIVQEHSTYLNTSLRREILSQLGGSEMTDGLAEFSLPSKTNIGINVNETGSDMFEFADQVMTSFKSNPYSWMNSSKKVNSQTVGLSLTNSSKKPMDTSEFGDDVQISIPRDASKIPPKARNHMRPYKDGVYRQDHNFNLSSGDMSIHVQMIPMNETHQFSLYLKYKERPSLEKKDYIMNWTIPDYSSCAVKNATDQVVQLNPDKDCLRDPYTIHLSNSLVTENGTYYLSVFFDTSKAATSTDQPTAASNSREKRAIPDIPCTAHGRMKRSCVIIPPPPPKPTTLPPYGGSRFSGFRAPNLDYQGRPFNVNDTPHYDIRVFSSNCLFLNEANYTWGNKGCKVGDRTRPSRVHCLCNHLTNFASDFLVAPNPIDFDKVFSADLSKNFLVITVVCGLFGLYLLAAVFARRADKRDTEKTGATPLPFSALPGSHSYLLSIHTGVRQNAGTTAAVCIVLSGDDGESQPILLMDPNRPLFTRGANNDLILTLPTSLGNINHVRVWHDNSGDSPSWYLSRIAIEDTRTNERWYFICERWLAVEEEDGRVDRILAVASDKELTHFQHLFVSKTVKELGDGHLWFSILTRPPASVFTRVQRLSCCLSLLYCTMITSCMFYNTGGKVNKTFVFFIGSYSFDLIPMIIGLQSSLIVFPVNLALVQVFRSIRPKEVDTRQKMYSELDYVEEAFADISTCSSSDENMNKEEEEEEKKQKEKKKKGLHPNWRYFAWTVCVLSTLASSTFTVFYSLSWGPDLANKWLLAFVMSFFQSVLLIQPIKVVFASIFFALIIKKPVDNDEDTNNLQTENYGVKSVEDLLKDLEKVDDIGHGPPDELLLIAARKQRLKEIRMSTILKEIFTYFLFMAVLLMVAYGNRDANAYLFRKSLHETFVELDDTGVNLYDIGDGDTLWHWARETLVRNLYPGVLYNNKTDKYKGFIDDRYNYLVGISRLRQERVATNSCKVPQVFRGLFPSCNAGFSMSTAETEDFNVGWEFLNRSAQSSARKRRSVMEQFDFAKNNKKLTKLGDSSGINLRRRRGIEPIYASTSGRQKRRKKVGGQTKTYYVLENAVLPDGSIQSCATRWVYHTFYQLRGFPYWGEVNLYGGGGYPADLGYDYSTAMTVVADLHSHNWIDAATRAVFVELTMYNANTNLFGVAFLFVEFLPTGGAFPHAQFAICRLYSNIGSIAKFVFAMEIIMLLFMFYFIYRECKLVYKQRMAYFNGFWNWIEVAMVVLEFLLVVLYFARMWEVDKNFIELHHNPKDFVSFQYAAAADETLNNVIGILVFLVTLRFIKLLRFNKRMALLGNTISIIAKPIGLFLISFGIAFVAFACMGHLMFGGNLDKFKGFISTIETQLSIVLGDFDYVELESTNRVFGPLYFLSFMYFIVMFLMNMFLAIINDSFADVKTSNDELDNEYEMVEFILDRFKSQLGLNRKQGNSRVKTPFGYGPAVQFWEYKHRNDSVYSDSEFSTKTNFTALKIQRKLAVTIKDLDVVLDKLKDVQKDDVESDIVLMKSLCGPDCAMSTGSSLFLNPGESGKSNA